MILDNAINLKQNMIAKMRSLIAIRERRAGFATSAGDGSIGVAFGIAPSRANEQQFKLAIRFRSSNDRIVNRVLKELPRLNSSELDIVTRITYHPRATLRPGCSIGHGNITAGTLGAIVEDDNNYYMLSNNHVLANSDNARRGDSIWKPGPSDANEANRIVVGYLNRWEPFNNASHENIDAALAVFSDEINYFYPWTYSRIGDINPDQITDRHSVQRVVKQGRTTQLTKGIVSAVSLDGVEVDYGSRRRPRVITFDNQIEIVHVQPNKHPFSQAGDSGSLIIDRDTNRPFALLFAGGTDDNGIDRTLANFIPDVLRKLEVRFVR